ncbi:MAG: hypothetical protein LC808_22955 [Actinobacteria bacterium]|nr:hypothetical protein [Actinomycetota bacterium]
MSSRALGAGSQSRIAEQEDDLATVRRASELFEKAVCARRDLVGIVETFAH